MAQLYSSIPLQKSQGEFEVLKDKDERGKERPWHVRKLENQYISAAYAEFNEGKAARVGGCAEALFFTRCSDNGRLKLKQAAFCRVRLCPVCAWRRSLKTHAHMSKILEAAKPQGLSYMMVTLTLRNCSGKELTATLDKLLGGFKNLTKRKAVAAAWRGWYRGVEVTHNLKNDTFHPHIHALVAVNKSYFTSAAYIKQAELAQMWRECCKLDYDPVIDIRKCYKQTVNAVSEVAKYTTKTSDIVCFDDWDFTVSTLQLLDAAFDKRRFIAYGGLFKELHKQLNLDDTEDGDLINIGDGDDDQTDSAAEWLYWWHTGYARYIR